MLLLVNSGVFASGGLGSGECWAQRMELNSGGCCRSSSDYRHRVGVVDLA